MLKNKNQAFTLIEVLAVIIILGLVVLITFVLVNNIIQGSRERSYQIQLDRIDNASRKWILDNNVLLVEDINIPFLIAMCHLIRSDYFETDEPLIDPRNGETMDGCVEIRWDPGDNQFVYTYKESTQCPPKPSNCN